MNEMWTIDTKGRHVYKNPEYPSIRVEERKTRTSTSYYVTYYDVDIHTEDTLEKAKEYAEEYMKKDHYERAARSS